jgi:cupin 2 domain-containing protein
MPIAGNLFENLSGAEEEFTTLSEFRRARIERIVSTSHASSPGFWYGQEQAEWVVLLSGSAALLLEGEATSRVLHAGD